MFLGIYRTLTEYIYRSIVFVVIHNICNVLTVGYRTLLTVSTGIYSICGYL